MLSADGYDHFCMMANTSEGREARKQFIQYKKAYLSNLEKSLDSVSILKVPVQSQEKSIESYRQKVIDTQTYCGQVQLAHEMRLTIRQMKLPADHPLVGMLIELNGLLAVNTLKSEGLDPATVVDTWKEEHYRYEGYYTNSSLSELDRERLAILQSLSGEDDRKLVEVLSLKNHRSWQISESIQRYQLRRFEKLGYIQLVADCFKWYPNPDISVK